MPADNESRWWLEPLPEGAEAGEAHGHDDEPLPHDQDAVARTDVIGPSEVVDDGE